MKIRRRTGKPSNVVRLEGELKDAVDHQLSAFRSKFGRDPLPHEPLFFDPSATTPVGVDPDEVEREIVAAMEAAGIAPRLIHAYRRTGRMVSDETWASLTPAERKEWLDALDEYDHWKAHSN